MDEEKTTPVVDMKQLLRLVSEYNALINEKARLEAEVKSISEKIEVAKKMLVDAMLDAEVPGIEYEGYSWKLTPKTKYSAKGGVSDPDFIEAMKEFGWGDIVKETVNAQTLQGAMSDLEENTEEGIPEGLKEHLNIYPFTDISRRTVSRRK